MVMLPWLNIMTLCCSIFHMPSMPPLQLATFLRPLSRVIWALPCVYAAYETLHLKNCIFTVKISFSFLSNKQGKMPWGSCCGHAFHASLEQQQEYSWQDAWRALQILQKKKCSNSIKVKWLMMKVIVLTLATFRGLLTVNILGFMTMYNCTKLIYLILGKN